VDVVDRAYRFIHTLFDESTGGELLPCPAQRDPLPQWKNPELQAGDQSDPGRIRNQQVAGSIPAGGSSLNHIEHNKLAGDLYIAINGPSRQMCANSVPNSGKPAKTALNPDAIRQARC
jgi:hypothetical protein